MIIQSSFFYFDTVLKLCGSRIPVHLSSKQRYLLVEDEEEDYSLTAKIIREELQLCNNNFLNNDPNYERSLKFQPECKKSGLWYDIKKFSYSKFNN